MDEMFILGHIFGWFWNFWGIFGRGGDIARQALDTSYWKNIFIFEDILTI